MAGDAVRRISANCYEVDLSSPEDLRRLHELIAGPKGAPVGAIINFLGFCRSDCDELEDSVTMAEQTFQLVKEFVADLRSSARAGGGWFVNVTAIDGQFGLGEREAASVAAAGTLGISKTLQREFESLRVKTIDVDPSIASDLLAARLLEELAADDELVEVGLTRQGRWQVALKQEPAPQELAPLPLDEESVVLITGGAYGVTAEIAQGLAAAARSRLILVGRSPLPEAETPHTCGLDKTALREFLFAEARRAQGAVLPAEIERRVQRVLKDRQILANLDACRAAGATVEYHSLDVRDAQQFGQLIDDLYERYGRIDGVVHGAGVIEDKRIADKTAVSFAKVFRTKVDGAWTLARKLRPESLKFLLFFGSVSGRFGNAGQVDYSAANEALNKLAGQLARRWPARVVSINWGPWDAGMVGDELRRLYASRGIELIPVAQGVQAFLDELRRPAGAAEVVISGSIERMARAARNRAASQAVKALV